MRDPDPRQRDLFLPILAAPVYVEAADVPTHPNIVGWLPYDEEQWLERDYRPLLEQDRLALLTLGQDTVEPADGSAATPGARNGADRRGRTRTRAARRAGGDRDVPH